MVHGELNREWGGEGISVTEGVSGEGRGNIMLQRLCPGFSVNALQHLMAIGGRK
jgi:hypothetical protein